MFKLISVTQRSLCKSKDAFLDQLEAVAAGGVDSIILREKDLNLENYAKVAQKVIDMCQKNEIDCILHSFPEVALALKHFKIHLPLPILEKHPEMGGQFEELGVSVHSLEQAKKALAMGATYLIAGHIFETDCKKGVRPRGVGFLKDICCMTDKPVYGIGGINKENIMQIRETGAKGACIMSGLMKAPDPQACIKIFKQRCETFV